jgi:hypothetical protein
LRIEVDNDLAAALDSIKGEDHLISGRGHADTVRFLANYYRQHKPIEELVKSGQSLFETFLLDFDDKVAEALRRAFWGACGDVIKTFSRSPAKDQGAAGGR